MNFKDLNALSLREKVLLSALLLLVALYSAFYAASFLQMPLKNYLQKNLISNSDALGQGVQKSAQTLKENENFLQNFRLDNSVYLDEIYKFATQHKITFKELKSEASKAQRAQNIQIYEVFLSFSAPFFEGLSFLNNLEKSPLALKIDFLDISKEETKLNFKLTLSFAKIIE